VEPGLFLCCSPDPGGFPATFRSGVAARHRRALCRSGAARHPCSRSAGRPNPGARPHPVWPADQDKRDKPAPTTPMTTSAAARRPCPRRARRQGHRPQHPSAPEPAAVSLRYRIRVAGAYAGVSAAGVASPSVVGLLANLLRAAIRRRSACVSCSCSKAASRALISSRRRSLRRPAAPK